MPVIPKPTGPISHVRRRAIFDHPKSPVDEETYQEYKVSLCDFAILTCLAYDEKMPQPELTQIFRECLNPMASYERQQPSALEHVKRECRERFPFFDRYADNWAISVLIRDYLYNSVRNHNRRRDRLPADTITQPELNAQEDPGDTQLSPSEIAEVGNTFLMANPQESVPPSSDVFRALINACKEEKAIPEHEKVQHFNDHYNIQCGTCGLGPFSVAHVSLCTILFVMHWHATEAVSLEPRVLNDLELLFNQLQLHQVCTMRLMAVYCLGVIHEMRCRTESSPNCDQILGHVANGSTLSEQAATHLAQLSIGGTPMDQHFSALEHPSTEGVYTGWPTFIESYGSS
ncbi:hypothetical protein NLI96_g128 [Meripilus lineatus]|uniref:Uncharacterized protein n=1 Tax=Meripilus lineatus TaxID=2056292 RepID=A0AAD5YP67_9APHY|nr:hypothetical protein NLI96_g128 [Physisporinus lineatus]